jgi:hypothetical protein
MLSSELLNSVFEYVRYIIDDSLSDLPACSCQHLLLVGYLLQVHLWDCHGQQNQQWQMWTDNSLRIPNTNLCLDVRSSGIGMFDLSALKAGARSHHEWILSLSGILALMVWRMVKLVGFATATCNCMAPK